MKVEQFISGTSDYSALYHTVCLFMWCTFIYQYAAYALFNCLISLLLEIKFHEEGGTLWVLNSYLQNKNLHG